MKKTSILFIAAGLPVASASAASLIAGWDFASLSTPPTQTINANWSDVTGDGLGNTNGNLYFDGSNGSDVIPTGFFGNIAGTSSSDIGSVNQIISTRFVDNQLSNSPVQGLSFTGLQGNQFTFEVNNNDATTFNNLVLTFAAAQQGGSVTIDWEAGTSVAGLTSIGQTITSTTAIAGGELETVNLTGIQGSTIFIRGTLTSMPDAVILDNFQVVGDVVPEPSTYAMIAGVAVLTIAMFRRRKN